MSNTIRRPRKRPRVRSMNFRSLWWLIQREAAARIIDPQAVHLIDLSDQLRFSRLPTFRVCEKAGRILVLNEARRIYP